jgi:hypothetical protein
LALKQQNQKASKPEDLRRFEGLSKEAKRLYHQIQIFEQGIMGILVGDSANISPCLESSNMDYLWGELRALH